MYILSFPLWDVNILKNFLLVLFIFFKGKLFCFYFKGYKSVVRGRWWFENKRCGKHQLRLTRNWLYDEELVRFYHSICLLTGDWCWELPLRTDLSTCFSIFIFQFNWSKILKQKHEEIMNIYESMNMSICKNVKM